MNRKGKTPSDIPLAPEKHSDMLWKLSMPMITTHLINTE